MSDRASLTSLTETQKFLRDLDSVRHPSEIAARVVQRMARFGVEHVIAATMPPPDADPIPPDDQILFLNYPTAWMERYVTLDYLANDPAVERAKATTTAFGWSELGPAMDRDPVVQRMIGEAAEFRIKDGFTGSVATLDGQLVVFSLAGEHLDPDPEARRLFPLVAIHAITRAIELRSEPSVAPTVRLTVREREALQWASEGKSDWEIGAVMNISEHGADKHLRLVRAKLGAVSRAHAVAEAIRRGLIS